MEKVRRIFYNVMMAVGIFLFWTVVMLLICFRQEVLQFLEGIYLTGTVKSLVVLGIPIAITVGIIRLDK